MGMKQDAKTIIDASLKACLPDAAVARALNGRNFGTGKLVLVAIGKAAWQMAACAADKLGDRLSQGVVITKYDHSMGDIPRCEVCEAGHPVPDANSFAATRKAIDLATGLTAEDTVLFLVSGGGSALFEEPLIPQEDLDRLTRELLASGADIVEMNTLRKRFSAVKGGRFARICAPAKVFAVVLSDIIGDPLDMIASGPACPDSSTCEEALAIVEKYNLTTTSRMQELLKQELPKTLDNVETLITGSVRELCRAAAETCEALGYGATVLTDTLTCEARDAGKWLAAMAAEMQPVEQPLALIAGGETVVHLTGHGKGGRNQELALAAAAVLDGRDNVLLFSVGSDGTDGPTDAAGGMVDGSTAAKLAELGYSIPDVLQENDAYTALKAADALIITGPTGTNVNDVAVLLLR